MKIMAWPARSNAARNPFQKLLYDAVEAGPGAPRVVEFSPRAALTGPAPDILHIHWPDAFLAAGAGWRFWPRYILLRGLLTLLKARGTRIVWTAHNLQRDGQRHGAKMARLFWPWFLKTLDGVIFMTRTSAEEAARLMPGLAAKPQAVIPHGHYGPLIPPAAPKAPEGPPALLFFGSITRYKNAWKVLQAFQALPAGSARLEIRGKVSLREPDEKLLEGLADLPPEIARHVTFEDRFLPEDALVAAIRAADLVVFPYSDVLNSGAAIFALSAGRPLLASDNTLFRELQQDAGPDWVRLIEGELDADQMAAALQAARAQRLAGATPDLAAFDWDRIGAATADFYAKLAR